jgi:Fe-S oxidoreductase/nitrate reductase gamma subunit
MSPVSYSYWGLSGYIIFWLLFAVAWGLFTLRAIWLWRLVKSGRDETRSENLFRRIRFMLVEVIGQRCNLKSVKKGDLAGLGHALMFWGFSLFLISYLIFIGFSGGFGFFKALEGSLFEKIYLSLVDVAGILVMAAVVWAAVRRYIQKPSRLKASPEAGVILGLVFLLMVLHFSVEGLGMATRTSPAVWPPLGAALGKLLDGLSQNVLETAYRGVWWLHYILILAFMVYIPRSKHLHILTSPLNLIFKSYQARGALRFIDLDKSTTFGATEISGFTWKQNLDLLSCTECGRCHSVCPAPQSGKSLSPRQLILNLKHQLIETGAQQLRAKARGIEGPPIIGQAVSEQEIWECVSCRACQSVCPVNIEHIEKIVDLRRGQVLMKAKMPTRIQQFYKNIEENSNPWGKAWVYRANWSEGQNIPLSRLDNPIDTILWSGCLGAYDERIQRLSIALSRLLKMAGIHFTVLGQAEKCCGEAVRRTGNEYLFQKLARQNIATFKQYQIKRIITICPHCYNVFKNEYPQLGGNYEVVHHSEMLSNLLDSQVLRSTLPLNKTVVYHDPCYLGRHNEIFNAPRQVLKSIPELKLIEKNPCAENALCCGAGGGGMWMNESGQKRISQVLLDQVTAVGPEILATACPYCLTMLENEAREKGLGNALTVMDIVEVLQSAGLSAATIEK